MLHDDDKAFNFFFIVWAIVALIVVGVMVWAAIEIVPALVHWIERN